MFSQSLIDKYKEDGLITVRDHNDAPLRILNYTPKAQFARAWDEVTLKCRGLIIDQDCNIVSRPFDKFFNIAEHESELLPDLPKSYDEAYEKFDGSLGISYMVRGIPQIATRGSFNSDQAIVGSNMLLQMYPKMAEVITHNPDLTFLFEIIYPSNRIVVDYGDREELVLLAVRKRTGEYLPHHHFAKVGEVPFAEAVDELTERPNAEGYVLRYDNGMMAKMKFDEYVRLHALLTNVSTKSIWELLKNEQSLDEILDNVPDEFYDWVMFEYNKILERRHKLNDRILEAVQNVPQGVPRKEQAQWILSNHKDISGAIFKRLDGKPYEDIVWKMIKPTYEQPFRKDIDA